MSNQTRLTKTDLAAIEHEVSMLTGTSPSLESITREGHRESRWLLAALEGISGAGRVVTLLIAELIQAGAALVICGVFALLEYWRVVHGAEALGQKPEQAGLIAFAVVTANVVHPIYALRQLRGQQHLTVVRATARGFAEAFWRRLWGKPVVESTDLYHNPTLHVAAAVITWSTVVLAVYDILGPLLTQIATSNWARPPLIMTMELLMGLGLSIAGVFFLQSAAHEIGVRTLTDQPQRLVDILAQRRDDHERHVEQVREAVRARYIAAKLADQERKENIPFGNSALGSGDHASGPMTARVNGHGGGNIAAGS